MSRLRSYRHHAAEPWYNMAFDEAMLERVTVEPDLILARLYTWKPAALSIGVNQRVEKAIRLDLLGDTPLVRRITGGRAVFHDPGELTYALALNLDNPVLAAWRGSVSAVYLRLAEGLRRFLDQVGRSAQIVRRSADLRPQRSDRITAPCFASAARYELADDRGKVVASAQHQSGRAILQHGSMKLNGIAPHPALSAVATALPIEDQPIAPESLECLSTQFAAIFADLFGLSADKIEAGEAELPGVRERADRLRREPLARRIPLERYSR